MKYTKQIVCIFAMLCIIFAMGTVCAAINGDPVSTDDIANIPEDASTAYIYFEEEFRGSGITAVDGLKDGITDPNDPNWSEISSENGVIGRKVYKANFINMNLDPSFYDEGDTEFIVSIYFYDYGPSVGYFHFDYNSQTSPSQRISIQKLGINPGWHKVMLYVKDAKFNGGLPGGADFRLANNAYNLYSKIEITNVSKAKREGVALPAFNQSNIDLVADVGLYGGDNFDYDSTVTRKQVLYELIDSMGLSTQIKREALLSSGPYHKGDIFIDYAIKNGIASGPESDFRPDDEITVRELLTFYIRAFGYGDGNEYLSAEQYAKRIGIVTDIDMMYLMDTPATKRQVAAVIANSLTLENKRTGVRSTTLLYKTGKLTFEQLEKIDQAAAFEAYYETPKKHPADTIIDKTSGRTIKIMNLPKAGTVRPYVTNQQFTSDGSRFIVADQGYGIMYEYNIKDETLHYLDRTTISGTGYAHITSNDVVFYGRSQTEIWKMDLNTYEKELVSVVPEERKITGLQATDDGKYLTCFWYEQDSEDDWVGETNRIRIVPRLNTETGEWDTTTIVKVFESESYPQVGHPIMNPKYDNLVMFCHEGTTQYVHDRIWLGDFNTGETKNLFVQATRPGDKVITGEPTGHEVWSMDGNYVYFIKYPMFGTNVGISGMARISKDGINREYVNDEYLYWHCYGSPDNKWMVADTQEKDATAKVVLASTETYESILLADFALPKRTPDHPYQPHPVFSQDGNYINWQMINPLRDNALGCAWMDISDIRENAPQGDRFKLNDKVSYPSYTSGVNYVEKTTVEDVEAVVIPKGNGLYLDVDDKVIFNDNTSVKVTITYLDNFKGNINVYYTSGIKSTDDLCNRENMVTKISTKGTGKWVTEQIEISDINMANGCKFVTDLRVEGSAELTVSDISVN